MLYIFDENGNVRFDGSRRIFKFLGQTTIGGENTPRSGSIVHPMFTEGKPGFFIFVDSGQYFPRGGDAILTPAFDRINWFYPYEDGSQFWQRPRATVLYGVF